MNVSKKGFQATAIFGLLFLLGLVALYFTINDSLQLVHAIQHHTIRIDFQKGVYYLFGGGLIFFLFPIWILLLYITDSAIEKAQKIQRIMLTFFGVCLASMPVLSLVRSISVGNYLENRGYTYCDNLSTQWLFDRTMVYQKNLVRQIPNKRNKERVKTRNTNNSWQRVFALA